MKLHHIWQWQVRGPERKTSRLTIETELYLEGEEEVRKRYEAVHGIIHEDNPETEYKHTACTHARTRTHARMHARTWMVKHAPTCARTYTLGEHLHNLSSQGIVLLPGSMYLIYCKTKLHAI